MSDNIILNPTRKQRVVAGYVWYDKIKVRPCYEPVRKIERGKKKGWFEVMVLAVSDDYGLHLRKKQVEATDILWRD